jgi:hypothetical protein
MDNLEPKNMEATGNVKLGMGKVYATDEIFVTNKQLTDWVGSPNTKHWGVRFVPEADTFKPAGRAQYLRGHPQAHQEIPGGARQFWSREPVNAAQILNVWPIT